MSTIAPDTGDPATEVTLTGTGLDQVTEVLFAHGPLDPGALHRDSATQLRVRVPLRVAAAGQFILRSAAGDVASPTFTPVFQTPAITRVEPVTPAPGAAPAPVEVGSEVAIIGTHLASATSIRFAGANVTSFRVESPERIVVTVPATYTRDVRVVTRGGQAFSPEELRIQPVITSIAPLSGLPGSQVVITGTGLANFAYVRFGDTWTPFDTRANGDFTELRAIVPAGAAPGQLRVVTYGGGRTTSSQGFTIAYAPPAVGSMAPATGVPGTEVTIEGANLAGVTEVSYAGTPLFPGSWRLELVGGSVRLKAQVPADAGTGVFSLRNPAGASVDSPTFTITPLASRTALLDQALVRGANGRAMAFPAFSRSEQYSGSYPKAPVFHAYHAVVPRFALHLSLPAPFQEALPAAVRTQLATLAVPAPLLEIHVLSQTIPDPGEMLFRPHYWLYPQTPNQGLPAHDLSRPAGMGLYADPGTPPVAMDGHPAGTYLASHGIATSVHTHDYVEEPVNMISSSNTHRVPELDGAATRTLWSLVHDHAAPVRPGRTAATLHLLLTDAEHGALQALAQAPTLVTFRDLLRAMAASPLLATSPATPALQELVRPRVTAAHLAPAGTAGDLALTLTGTGFTGASRVTVDGIAATFIAVVDDTRIEATIPGPLAPAPARAYRVETEPFLVGTANL